MQFVVTQTLSKSIAVEAETPQAALDQVKGGTGTPITVQESYGVQPRVQNLQTPTVQLDPRAHRIGR